ncbi:MAG: tyrosine-type recombinase/integrase [Gemmatimonas sp.]|nr:tyrosine-type recombinase/integrase [Gemmatimonas sp.]
MKKTAEFAEFADRHLLLKARSGRVTEQWLAVSETHLKTAVEFLGAGTLLHTIDVERIQEYALWLAQQPVKRGKGAKRPTLSRATQRKYLNTLSNLFARAMAEGCVAPGFNPVALMMEKPTANPQEAKWLEPHEAALILESARTWNPKRENLALPCAHPLIGTSLLTGGREKEILGLEVEDLSFDRRTVTFRPNEHRRLKTLTSHRTVPIHPQLEGILREYVFGGRGPISGLLFPATRVPKDAKVRIEPKMITDWRKSLDAIAQRAGWKEGEIRSKMFRHTYCAARLQTLDNGAPISVYTVAKELGHGGDAMVRRVYGHLGAIRHRSEHVEFRVEDHIKSVKGYAERVRKLAQ